MNKKFLAHIGLFCTNLFFALNLSTVKYLTNNRLGAPFGLNIMRIGFSALLFWILYLIDPVPVKFQKKDLFKLVVCAIMALPLNQMLFMKGLYYTFSIHVALLFLITPILITLIAGWMLKERLPMLRLIGLALAVSGAFILIYNGSNSGGGRNIFLGDTLIILSALAYTFYFILVKPLMNTYPPLFIIRWVFTIGLIICFPFSIREFNEIHFHDFSSFDFFILFLVIVPGTFLAYLFNIYGIKQLGAAVSGTYIYLQPLFAVIIAMLFLKEQLQPYKILSGVLIFIGVFIANRKSVAAK